MSDLSILASYAHPDDEQGVTGTLRLALDQGIRVGLICATRGEVGEISDPALATPETLGQVREQELRNAMSLVGLENLYFLDYRDSGMVGTPPNQDPRAFINADEEEAVGRIVKIIRQFKPTVMTTFEATGGYGHPDHLAIHKWTTIAFHKAGDPTAYPEAGPAFAPRRLFYSGIARSGIMRMAEFFKTQGIHSVMGINDPTKMGMPDEEITNRVNVEKYNDLKRQSLLEHKTQNNPNGPLSRLPEETWKEWRTHENFGLAAGDPIPEGADPADLFAGLR